MRNEIKAYIVRQGMTMQEVVDVLSDVYGWSDSVSNLSNLSNKLQRESLRYKEAVQLADALGYDIQWVNDTIDCGLWSCKVLIRACSRLALDEITKNIWGGTMTKNFELLTFEELLKLPIDIESCFDPIFDPPQELIDEWQATYDNEPDGVPTFYVTEGDGPLYFYYGNTRIRVSEHFSDKGKPIGALLEDVIRYSAAHQTEKTTEN